VNKEAQIFIGEDNFNELGQFLTQSFSSCFVLVDENTLKHCYPLLVDKLPRHLVIEIPSGELNKNIETCGLIWARLTEANADRKSLLLNLGGGVIGDMGGFAATCYKRGISFINIPTTLLAMVDASVGGKTGINFMGFKNQVGVFNQPVAIFIYSAFLATLPQRELTSGFAEVIKHYLVADKNAFEETRRQYLNIRGNNWPELVKKNTQIKAHIVAEDPQEQGIRKALNFGHTIGHAIESWFLTDANHFLLHGEAVAVGMIAESYISFKKGLLTIDELHRITEVILRYFKLPVIASAANGKITELIRHDKKNEKDTVQFTLLQGIGNYSINNAVEEELIKESLNYYNSLLK
jgi:3-dehydroquinate synthase